MHQVETISNGNILDLQNQTVDLYADYTALYDIGLDKDMLENNLQHSLNLLKMRRLENSMVINIEKVKSENCEKYVFMIILICN